MLFGENNATPERSHVDFSIEDQERTQPVHPAPRMGTCFIHGRASLLHSNSQPMEQHLILVAEILLDRRVGNAEPRSDVVERRRVTTALVAEVNCCSTHGYILRLACLVAVSISG